MAGQIGRIVGEDPGAQLIDRDLEAAHRFTPGVERPSSLLDPAYMRERACEKDDGVDQAGAKIGAPHEVPDREFVSPVPEIVLSHEMMPETNAAVARAEGERTLDGRPHLLDTTQQEVGMAGIG